MVVVELQVCFFFLMNVQSPKHASTVKTFSLYLILLFSNRGKYKGFFLKIFNFIFFGFHCNRNKSRFSRPVNLNFVEGLRNWKNCKRKQWLLEYHLWN